MLKDIKKSLYDVLQRLKQFPEIGISVIISSKGFPIVSSKLPQDPDLNKIAAISATILSLGNKTSTEINLGEAEEIVLRTRYEYFNISPIGERAVFIMSEGNEYPFSHYKHSEIRKVRNFIKETLTKELVESGIGHWEVELVDGE